jgi:hypothetical protein
MRIRQLKFSCAIKADPVRAVLDCEDAAQVTMPATKSKLENPTQRFHQSCPRWRRSQLPLASSQSSKRSHTGPSQGNRAIGSSVVNVERISVGVHRASAWKHNIVIIAVALVLGFRTPRVSSE